MLIKYKFADGTITEVEVDESIGAVIVEMDRIESNADRKKRYHCCHSDDIEFEAKDHLSPETAFEETEKSERINSAFDHLTDKQQKYISMLADGLSLREIARRENKDIKTIRESVEGARKKFLKFF